MKTAEARVHGILRGGYYYKGYFIFHRALEKVKTKDFIELRFL